MNHKGLNPFGTGQCLTTREMERNGKRYILSQSLWNRAVSYDLCEQPTDQSEHSVSIPLEQGSVLRHLWLELDSLPCKVSIPLEQGSVLRQNANVKKRRVIASQSLWNRAVSYDGTLTG